VSPQPDFSTRARPRRLPRGEGLVLLLGVAAAVFAAGSALKVTREAREAHALLAAVRRDVDAESARLRTQSQRAGAGRVRVAQAEAAREASPDRIVAGVVGVLPPDARLESLAIDYGRAVSLEMLVVARDASAWDRLLERLGRAPAFRQVEPGPESREGEVHSTIRALWAEGPS
jgi:hypothetical protein